MGLVTILSAHILGQPATRTSDPSIIRLVAEGQEAIDRDQPEEAVKLFRTASKMSGDTCVECRVGETVALVQMGAHDAAVKSARKALSIATDDTGRASAHAAVGDSFITGADQKSLELARTEYQQAATLAPSTAIYHLKLGTALFKLLQDDAGKAATARYLELAPEGRHAKYARGVLADPRRARERFAPEFSVRTSAGDTLTLSSLKGKYVVLDFWATWCQPCVFSVGELKALTRKYSGDKLVLVSISADMDEARWHTFVTEKDMDWAQYWDGDHELRRKFGVREFPTYILIDPEGIIRERMVGQDPHATVVSRLKKALAMTALDKS
jgi:peroxiredoxin